MIRHNQATNTPTFATSLGADLYKSLCLQFEALQAHVAPLEIIFQGVDTPYHQHQREKDSEFIAVEDLLVGEDGVNG